MKGEPVAKLVPNLYNKKHYVIHQAALAKYVELGMVVKKVHRIVSFTQAAWMKGYIMHNTNLRTLATSDFRKISTNCKTMGFSGKVWKMYD